MRKITFEERPIGTREVRTVKAFSLEDIEWHFNEALKRIMEQLRVSVEISAVGHEEEGAEILRSQVVFIESAYDYFLHELIRLGVLNIFEGEWSDNDSKYLELQVSLGVLKKALSCQEAEDWLLEWITEKYSHVTLMDYSIWASNSAFSAFSAHIKLNFNSISCVAMSVSLLVSFCIYFSSSYLSRSHSVFLS